MPQLDSLGSSSTIRVTQTIELCLDKRREQPDPHSIRAISHMALTSPKVHFDQPEKRCASSIIVDIEKNCSTAYTPTETDPLLGQSAPPILSTELHGYLLMLLSTICFSGMSFLIHLASTVHSFPPMTSALIRGLVHTFLAALYLIVYRPSPKISALSSSQQLLLLFRGIVGSLDPPLLFLALTLLPVGDTIVIVCTSPMFTMLISHLTLKERISWIEMLAALICCVGVILVAQPGSEPSVDTTNRLRGSLAAIGSAIVSAVAYTTVRRLGSSVHYMASVISFSAATIVTSLGLGGAIGWGDVVSMKDGAFLAVWSALFAFAAQCFLNKGLQLCRAGPGTVIRNLDVPLSFFLGLVFLGETPSWIGIVGSVVTVGGTVMIAVANYVALRVSL